MKLDGQVAVITGGANGIGAETALRLLREGARVLIGDLNEANAERTLAAAAAQGQGDAIRFLKTDVADEPQMQALFDAAIAHFGRLDCVFNNAGIGGVFGPIAQTRVDDWDFTIAVLLRGVFLGMKHGARILQAQGSGGCIVSTASVAGYAAGAGAHAYSAAKAAVINLTRSVAVELAPQRIRVNAVAPGPLMTELFHRGKEAQAAQTILARQPWPEPGTAADVAGVLAFLASDDARFITGETLVVDGGLLARGPALFGEGSQSALLRAAGLDKGTTGEASEMRPRPTA
ncbi:MAG: SDR family oxidoreductase [Burkholderiales bacterium]|nr:SDR family oxidoreductase [Burkholderiales bacterium]